jgi:EmrB/QacA subfamily drug resistance transporter
VILRLSSSYGLVLDTPPHLTPCWGDETWDGGAGVAVSEAVPDAAPGPELDRRRMNLIFATVLLGMLLAALDQTIVSTALPTIVGDLGGATHITWVVSSYLLADTIATVLAGKFGDQFGRKLVFQLSAGLFVLASAACGLAQGMPWLITSRAVQGFGAGGLAVTATALIGDVIPLRERGKYQGALGAVFGVTTVLGPLLGGFFTDHLSWRWAFLVNLPVGVLVVVLAGFTMPSVRSATRPVIDYLGIAFVSLGAAGLTLGLSWGGTQFAWGSPTIIALFATSVVALALFVFFEARATDPILPLRLFRGPVFSICVALAFIVGFAMLGAMTFLPTYLQYVKGVSATKSGVETLPLVVGLLSTSILSGTVVGRTGRYKVFPVVGSLVMALGLFLLSRMGAGTSFWSMALAMLVLGVGIGLCMQVLTIIVQNTAEYRDLGVATSGVTFFRTLGSSFGAAIFGTVYSNVLSHSLPRAIASARGLDPTSVSTPRTLHQHPAAQIAGIVDTYAHALHVVFLAAVPVALAALLLALFLKEVPLRGTARAGSGDLGQGFGMPEGADSAQQLQMAIARLVRRTGRSGLAAVREASDTELDTASGWCVGQVHFRERFGRETSLQAIAERVRVPADVLRPAFHLTRDAGYLAGSDERLVLSDRGRAEMEKLSAALHAWLADELEDWGAHDDELLSRALGELARKFLDDDASVSRADRLLEVSRGQ